MGVLVGKKGTREGPFLSSLFPAPAAPYASGAPRYCADGDAQSYWSSGPDPASKVDVQLDFGAAKQIKAVEIDWEYPPQVCTFYMFVLRGVLPDFVSVFCARHLSCRSPGVGDGRPYMALLGTTCRQPSMWAQLLGALRCGSA